MPKRVRTTDTNREHRDLERHRCFQLRKSMMAAIESLALGLPLQMDTFYRQLLEDHFLQILLAEYIELSPPWDEDDEQLWWNKIPSEYHQRLRTMFDDHCDLMSRCSPSSPTSPNSETF